MGVPEWPNGQPLRGCGLCLQGFESSLPHYNMKKSVKLKLSAIFGVLLIVVFFVLFSYLIQSNPDFFEGLISDNFWGMFIYILINIIAVVFAPVTVLPLIAVAAGLWGWVIAGIVTIFGWFLGSVIAFLIARKFGVPLISRFVSLDKIYAIEEKVSIGNSFWSVLLLRLIIPVDILSYVLGLFSKIRLVPYAFATILGITPFAFVFAYLGSVPVIYQIVIGLIVLIVFAVWMIYQELFF